MDPSVGGHRLRRPGQGIFALRNRQDAGRGLQAHWREGYGAGAVLAQELGQVLALSEARPAAGHRLPPVAHPLAETLLGFAGPGLFHPSRGGEQVQGLLQAWPTADDFKAVANYDGPEELRDVELCIKQVAAVPRSEARLKLLRLARSLDSLHHASAELAVLRRACEELLGSRTLRALLDAALVLGNYINGDAGAGFSLDALAPSLMSLKGEKGTTALHCLCANRAQEDPFFCSKLHSELASLKTASQISRGLPDALPQKLRSESATGSKNDGEAKRHVTRSEWPGDT
ncbi:unnamed protein product [Effrenium voratum]|uniref:FH2 domain-containing protein n=1 Tax=Effrenium voratum TaxID=2562239 RepID=A0AA36MMY9_9DINO|nr:unnamed protein product [Effrenium voratum]